MPSPLTLSRAEIREELREEIAWLEETSVENPRWKWPGKLLPLVRELEALATGETIDPDRARDLTIRLRKHVRQESLKGFEVTIGYAEALEALAAQDQSGGHRPA